MANRDRLARLETLLSVGNDAYGIIEVGDCDDDEAYADAAAMAIDRFAATYGGGYNHVVVMVYGRKD